MLVSLAFAVLLATQAQHHKHVQPAPERPLPNPAELISRARETSKANFAARENYLCQAHTEQDDLNSDGVVKIAHTRDEESFFVNGHLVTRVLAKDGKQLSPEDAKKENARVERETKKYADPSQRAKAESSAQEQLNSALRMLTFTNERREMTNGRPTIVFDVRGNTAVSPQDLTDKFMQAMEGIIRFDEDTGHIVELNVKSNKDVRIMGGFLATVHKNSQLRLHFTQQKDGVWLLDHIEAAGDGRAALFLNSRIRYRQSVGPCRLYNVESTEGAGAKH